MHGPRLPSTSRRTPTVADVTPRCEVAAGERCPCPGDRRAAAAPARAVARGHRARVRRPHQDPDHRAAAGRTVPAMFLAAARHPVAVAGARHAARRGDGRGQRARAELRGRRRHRRGDEAHRAAGRWPRPGARRATRWSSGSCSACCRRRGSWPPRTCWPPGWPSPRSRSTCSSTRCCSSAAPSQNIVWGGAAGCMPVVIGWAAVTGTVEWPALVMFGVIFFWTPPHFWALAMRYRDDYAARRRADAARWWPRRRRCRGGSSSTRG